MRDRPGRKPLESSAAGDDGLPKRRREAATCGIAASLRRGLVGEQKSREIGMVSTGGGVCVDKGAPQGVGSRLGVRLDGWLDG